MKISYWTTELYTKVPFGISRETKTKVSNLFIQIEEGIGEAAPCPYFGDALKSTIVEISDVLNSFEEEFFEVEEIMAQISKVTKSQVIKAAVDIALHDLIGKRLNLPLYRLLGLSNKRAPQSSFTIGLASLEEMIEKTKAALEYPILKIKLGGKQVDDIEVMRKIREIAPNKTIRVDCNGGWTLAEALKKIPILAKLGIEFVEQPLPAEDVSGLKTLFKKTKLPIILDESVKTSSDVPKVIGLCHGINVKLMKTGGIREAIRTIHTARAHGLKIMIGSMLESSVAITAGGHISPLADYADLDGNILLANDPYTGLKLEDGWIKLPDLPGLGVQKQI